VIRIGIIEGRYRPGERIVEETVGSEYNLSRTPVREALHTLQAEGLVIIERNRGAVVRSLSPKDIEDLYELRAKLESLAAERAARRCTPADLAEMDAAISEFSKALLDDSVSDVKRLRALNAANQRFHGTVLRMADHSRLSQMLTRTVDIPLVFQSFQNFDHDERERSNLFHQLVRGAIAAGNPERAGQLMGEHILLARDALARRFQREGELADEVSSGP
jgi:DNA-binding GntR family transcriptional regulator